MNTTNWDTFKCRCSGIHKIMSQSKSNPQLTEKQALRLTELENKETLTEKQGLERAELIVKRKNSTKVVLSDTCIEFLVQIYAWEKWKRKPLAEYFEIKQMRKGKLAEPDAIMLLSVVEDVYYEKNKEQVENEFLKGEPDVFVGSQIMQASKITDIKNCWDFPVYLKKINNGLDNGNEDQVRGYMDITGAQEGEIAFTLVNMPEIMRLEYKNKLFYDGDYVTEESPEFLRRWEKMERDMMFDEIPYNQRVHKITIEPFSEFEKQSVYDRVKICREWLNNFDMEMQKKNLKSVPLQ